MKCVCCDHEEEDGHWDTVAWVVLRILWVREQFVHKSHHGLYGSTSCCISHGQVNGRGRFSTPHSSETPRPIFMKLEIYNYFPDTTPHAKFQRPTSTWVVWANNQFDARKFLSFFASSPGPQVTSLDKPHAQYVIIRRSAFWGLGRWNLKFDPHISKKT